MAAILSPSMLAYEDDFLLIIDKPAGMLVHPTVSERGTTLYDYVKAYYEANGINAERITTTDGDGKVIKDTVSFVKNGYWYTIDYLNKNYDRVPELPGMSMPFAETLISWFNVRPQGGNDAVTGYDYDKMTKGTNSLNFYYAKDTADWKGYEVSYLPIFKVLEVSNTVDEATAFALPPADFKAVANPSMRAYANRLLERQ